MARARSSRSSTATGERRCGLRRTSSAASSERRAAITTIRRRKDAVAREVMGSASQPARRDTPPAPAPCVPARHGARRPRRRATPPPGRPIPRRADRCPARPHSLFLASGRLREAHRGMSGPRPRRDRRGDLHRREADRKARVRDGARVDARDGARVGSGDVSIQPGQQVTTVSTSPTATACSIARAAVHWPVPGPSCSGSCPAVVRADAAVTL